MKVAICATTAISVNSQRPLIYTECSSWACSSVRPVKDRSDLSAMNFPPECYADAAFPAAGSFGPFVVPQVSVHPFGQAGRVSVMGHCGSDRENHRRHPVRLEPCARQRAAQVEGAVTDHVAHPTQGCEGDGDKEDAEEIHMVFGAARASRAVPLRRVGCHVSHRSDPPCRMLSEVWKTPGWSPERHVRRPDAAPPPRRHRAASWRRKYGQAQGARTRSSPARARHPNPTGNRGATASAWPIRHPSRTPGAGYGTAHQRARCTLPARDTWPPHSPSSACPWRAGWRHRGMMQG